MRSPLPNPLLKALQLLQRGINHIPLPSAISTLHKPQHALPSSNFRLKRKHRLHPLEPLDRGLRIRRKLPAILQPEVVRCRVREVLRKISGEFVESVDGAQVPREGQHVPPPAILVHEIWERGDVVAFQRALEAGEPLLRNCYRRQGLCLLGGGGDGEGSWLTGESDCMAFCKHFEMVCEDNVLLGRRVEVFCDFLSSFI